VRVDAPDLLAAVGHGIGKKSQHFLLAVAVHLGETLAAHY
jgi:hypothetical protein